MIAVDLSRQKELDADLKAIQKTEFAGQLKHVLQELKSAAENKTGTILRLNKKKFQGVKLPH